MPAGNLHIPQGRFYGVVQYEELGEERSSFSSSILKG
jgi:hypothetical protein